MNLEVRHGVSYHRLCSLNFSKSSIFFLQILWRASVLRGSLGSCEKYQQLCRVCGVVPWVYLAGGNAILLARHQGTGVGTSSSAHGPAPKCTHYLICTTTWKSSRLSLTREEVPLDGLNRERWWLCPPDSGSPGTRPHSDWQGRPCGSHPGGRALGSPAPLLTSLDPLQAPQPPCASVLTCKAVHQQDLRHGVAVRFEVIISVKPLDQCLAVSVCYYEYTRLKRWN